MKQILLFGNREKLGENIEPIDGFEYNYLKDLYDNYITIFTGKEINFEEVFRKVFIKKSNYKRDFNKHYKLDAPFKDLDGAYQENYINGKISVYYRKFQQLHYICV